MQPYGPMRACDHRMDFILGDNLVLLSNQNIDARDVTIFDIRDDPVVPLYGVGFELGPAGSSE